jgi:hypothetical protein
MNKKYLSHSLLIFAAISGGMGWSKPSYSATASRATRVAVSQGISSPAITSPVNFSHGYLFTNPAVAAEFANPYISLEGSTGDSSDTYGGELGLGNGSAGLAAGYIKNKCCDGQFGVIGGIGSNGLSGGVGFHEHNTYSVGMIFQPKGTHRIGLAADFQGSGGDSTSFGAGYSYHANSLIFALDASRRSNHGNSSVLVTPGLELSSNMVSLSVSYDVYMVGNRKHTDQLWLFNIIIQTTGRRRSRSGCD